MNPTINISIAKKAKKNHLICHLKTKRTWCG